MVTLANVQGSSLIADNSAFIERLEKAGIKASNVANKEREDQAFEESLAKAGGNTPLAKELARAERIRPGGAKLGMGILTSEDAIDVANKKREAVQAGKFATFLKPLKPDERATQIRKEAERVRAENPGADISNLVELMNMSTEKQDIEISKQEIFSTDVGKLSDFRLKQLAAKSAAPNVKQQEAFNTQISNVLALSQEQPDAQSGRAVIERVLNNPSVPEPVKAGLRAVLPQQQGIVETDINEQGTIPPSQLTQNIEATQRRLAPAATEPVPFTTIAKARKDLKNNLITEDEFKTLQKTPKEFKTSVGKLFGDQKIIIEEYGADSPQALAIQEAIKAEAKGEGVKLTEVGGVRKEFTKLSGDFIKMRDAVKKVQKGGDSVSAAGDLALIFNFMKVLDPGSVVRESEFATAAASGSLGQRIQAAFGKIKSGERLGPLQRKDFVDRANQLFEGQRDSQLNLEKSFTNLATSQGMKPEDVVIDFINEFRPSGKGVKTLTITPEQKTRLDFLRKKREAQ